MPEEARAYKKVFVSYSSRDKEAAENLCRALEDRKIQCWIAPRDVAPGSDWDEEIVDAIDQTAAMILILSSNSNESIHVKHEVERAVSKGTAVFPVRIADVQPSKKLALHISTRHWIDLWQPPMEPALDRLAGALSHLLQGETYRPASSSPTSLPASPPGASGLAGSGVLGAPEPLREDTGTEPLRSHLPQAREVAWETAASGHPFKKLADLSDPYIKVLMDERFLYFPDGSFLAKVPKQGGEVELAGRLGQFCQEFGSVGAEVDGYTYWAGGNLVQRCPVSGGEPEILAHVPEHIRYFCLTPTSIAWVTDGYGRPAGGLVQSMPRSGGAIVTIASGLKTSNSGGMVSDANTLYWIESNTGTVMVGSADTKGFTILCIGCAGDLLLQDEHHLYSLRGESIMEISKALTKANTSLAKGSCRELYKGPVWRSMAVDSEFVYFTAQYGIMRVRKMNQATESLVTNLGKPVLVLLDEANVYFIDAGPPAILGSIRKP